MLSNIRPELPCVIRDAYGIADNTNIRSLQGGLVNNTFLINPEHDDKFILRKLAPFLGSETVRDTCVIADHLSNNGWEAPISHQTIAGQDYIEDGNNVWHAEAHIDSWPAGPAPVSEQTPFKSGLLLGRWHHDVKTLDYIPRGILDFHNTQHYSEELKRYLYTLSPPAKNLGQKLLMTYSEIESPRHDNHQVIHGDPKLDNMLFRDGDPFTFIDFDCTMRDSPWTDIGDCLRSVNAKMTEKDLETTSVFEEFAAGYTEANEQSMSNDQFLYFALQSAKRITCELGMRYLADITDGNNYFSWDSTKYETRQQALTAKAGLQLQIIATINNQLNERDDNECAG